jgi:hypothetical protein
MATPIKPLMRGEERSNEQRRTELNARHAAGPNEFLSGEPGRLRSQARQDMARYVPPPPAQVRRGAAATVAVQLWMAGAPGGPKPRRKAGRGTVRAQAWAIAVQAAMKRIRKAGRGAFRLRALEVAAFAAERRAGKAGRGAFKGRRRPLRSRKGVSWVTEAPKGRRAHRATGRPRHRPKHDDVSSRQAVAGLQKMFRIDCRTAERVVMGTMWDGSARKMTARRERSFRERLRRN